MFAACVTLMMSSALSAMMLWCSGYIIAQMQCCLLESFRGRLTRQHTIENIFAGTKMLVINCRSIYASLYAGLIMPMPANAIHKTYLQRSSLFVYPFSFLLPFLSRAGRLHHFVMMMAHRNCFPPHTAVPLSKPYA